MTCVRVNFIINIMKLCCSPPVNKRSPYDVIFEAEKNVRRVLAPMHDPKLSNKTGPFGLSGFRSSILDR